MQKLTLASLVCLTVLSLSCKARLSGGSGLATSQRLGNCAPIPEEGRETRGEWRDVSFQSQRPQLKADIFLPPAGDASDCFPVMIAIHGGGWREGGRGDYKQFGDVAKHMAVHGHTEIARFAVIAPQYTLSSAKQPAWPKNLEDLQVLLRWVEAQSGRLRLDSSRIVLVGESAGAHLAMLLANHPPLNGSTALPRIRAVVSFFGPTDLETCILDSPDGCHLAAMQMLGWPMPGVGYADMKANATRVRTRLKQIMAALGEQERQQLQDASPLTFAKTTPIPTMFIHGTADSLIVPRHVDLMLQALQSAGDMQSAKMLIPGAGHVNVATGFVYPPGGRGLTREIGAFLMSNL